MDQICFETDFPHVQSTFPRSEETVRRLRSDANLSGEEVYKLVRGSAIKAFGLGRYGLTV